MVYLHIVGDGGAAGWVRIVGSIGSTRASGSGVVWEGEEGLRLG